MAKITPFIGPPAGALSPSVQFSAFSAPREPDPGAETLEPHSAHASSTWPPPPPPPPPAGGGPRPGGTTPATPPTLQARPRKDVSTWVPGWGWAPRHGDHRPVPTRGRPHGQHLGGPRGPRRANALAAAAGLPWQQPHADKTPQLRRAPRRPSPPPPPPGTSAPPTHRRGQSALHESPSRWLPSRPHEYAASYWL